jgi:threonyl-tRNA synthetase
MTENYAGDFPFWLAPEQIRLLPVTDEVMPYAEDVLTRLKAAGIRATIDHSGDRLGKLIRNGEQMKIPVLGVIGAKEAESQEISLRSRRDGDLGSVALHDLITAAAAANTSRTAGLALRAAVAAA